MGTLILSVVTFLVTHYPFSYGETVGIFVALKMMFDSLMNKQWEKAGNIAFEKSLELFESFMSNEDKRDLVVKHVWENMPFGLSKFATPTQIEELVDEMYETYVRSEASRKGLVKGTPDSKPVPSTADVIRMSIDAANKAGRE